MTKYALAVLAVLLSSNGLSIAGSAAEPPLDDRIVRLRSFVDLEYPRLARSVAMQGVVVVKATLDDEGNVIDVAGISGALPLLEAVLPNARQWKFEPNARKSAVIVYAFQVDQNGVCHDNARSLFRLQHFNYATITACTPTD
jgi:TonB family protein